MQRTRIKICGIANPRDARLASDAGADAIGMIFHPPSRRNIVVETAGEIVAAIGPFVTPVGVFVDATTEAILAMAGPLGLRVVQLHGDEPPEQVAELGRAGLRVIKALKVDGSLQAQLENWREALPGMRGALAGVVLETAGTVGGSGIANDFEAIAAARNAGQFDGLPPLIIAGGLCPENVSEVVRRLGPWAVDVSSGVEAAVGRKSPEKVRAFICAVQQAYSGRTS